MSIHRSMPYAEYAAHPALRSSHVNAFRESPRLLKDVLEGKIKRKSKALQFGTCGHMAVLEPGKFQSLLVTEPETYESADGPKAWSNNAKVCRAWHAAQASSGKLVVTGTDIVRIQTMLERMPREVRGIFEVGEAEVVVRNTIGGVEAQCRADWIGNLQRTEFKTIASIHSIEMQTFKFGYHIQDRFYSRLLATEMREQIPSRIVFAETNPPYRWRICQLDLDFIELADRAIDEALEGIQLCRAQNNWHDWSEVRELISPPSWTIEDDEEEEVESAL